MFPVDAQSASQGYVGNVGDEASQLCGFSCHLGVQGRVKGQRVARLWEETTREI